jgi:hypothetical protein
VSINEFKKVKMGGKKTGEGREIEWIMQEI